MAYSVDIVESLPQPIENPWLALRCMLNDMLAHGQPIKLTLHDNEHTIDHARSTVHAWSKANNLKGKVHTTRGESDNTLYIYLT